MESALVALWTGLLVVLVVILAVLLFRGTPQQLRLRRMVFAFLLVFWALQAAFQRHFWIR